MEKRYEALDVPCPNCCAAKDTDCIRDGLRGPDIMPHAERWERLREWSAAYAPVSRLEATEAKEEATGTDRRTAERDLVLEERREHINDALVAELKGLRVTTETLGGMIARLTGERDEAIAGLRAAQEIIGATKDQANLMIETLNDASALLDMAWAFNAFDPVYASHTVQIRKAGPSGKWWFIARDASSNLDGILLDHNGKWSSSYPATFKTSTEAFSFWREKGCPQ